MKKKNLLLMVLMLAARLLSAQNTDSCWVSLWAWNQPGGGANVYSETYGDTLNVVSYEWNTGQSSSAIFVNTPGTYCVTVTFVSGCSAYDCIDFGGGGGSTCMVTIHEDSTGNTLIAGAWSASWPFQYLWNTGETTQAIQAAGPGVTYCVTLTDATGCTATNCITTNSGGSTVCNTQIGIEADAQNNALLLTANATGLPPFAYLWMTGETTQDIAVPLTSGPIGVTVTDAAGCQSFSYIYGSFDSCGVSLTQLGSTLQANPTYGIPATYVWSTGETGPSISPAFSGTYCVTATNAFGCTATACLLFTGTPPPNCPLTAEIRLDANAWPDFFRLSAQANNSTPPLEYVWRFGNNQYSYIGKDVHFRPELGPYKLTITDALGCTATAQYNDPTCLLALGSHYDDSLGLQYIDIQSLGVGMVWYSLNGGSVGGGTGGGNSSISVAGPGLYCVTITDEAGCVQSDCVVATGSPAACAVHLQKSYEQPDIVRIFAMLDNPYEVTNYAWSTGETDNAIETNVPGTYCLTVTYANGCSAIDCIEISPNARIDVRVTFGITGQYDQRFGDLWLIEHDPAQGGILTAIDTVPFDSSWGCFANVLPGTYRIKASVSEQSALYPNYMPTYWESALLWSDGQELTIDHPFKQAFALLRLKNGQNPGGPGFIGGLVSEGANLHAGDIEFSGSGQPLPGVSIVLTLPDGTAVAQTRTDASGHFEFAGLAFGTYHVWVDIPGLPPVFMEVVIGPANPSVSSLSALVDEDSIRFVGGSTSTDDLDAAGALDISPNPASDVVSISAKNLPGAVRRLSVLNALGQLVFEKTIENESLTMLSLPVSAWLEGSYFVVADLSDGGKVIEKLVVAKN